MPSPCFPREQAGVRPPVGRSWLRPACAWLALEEGRTLGQLQNDLGHVSNQTTCYGRIAGRQADDEHTGRPDASMGT